MSNLLIEVFLCFWFKFLLIALFDCFTKDFISGYVDQAQYIPVQQQRPQVLQIALPPNMSPQNRPRWTINSKYLIIEFNFDKL